MKYKLTLQKSVFIVNRTLQKSVFIVKRRIFVVAVVILLLLGPTVYLTLIHPKSTEAAPWAQTAGSWTKRKNVILTNNSGQTFEANTTYAINVNTQELVAAGDLNTDCSDLRVYYQPTDTTSTKLAYYFDVAAEATNCADSTSTKVYFPLQANLSNGADATEYYIYYDNASAVTEASVDAFNVGSKQALMVCPFNGDTECINGDGAEDPTTESGAIRYSGGKSALSFDGANDSVTGVDLGNIRASNYTVEAWVNSPKACGVSDLFYMDIVQDGNAIFNIFCEYGTYRIWFWDTYSPTSMDFRADIALTPSTWHHVAFVYLSTTKTAKIFFDGSEVAYDQQVAGNGTPSTTFSYILGFRTNSYFHGIVDEARISNIARYTANFTPQTSPFVRDEHTKLLLHFDENGDDPRNTGKAIDDSGNGNHGTITGAKYVAGLVGVDGPATDTGNISSSAYASHDGVFIEEGTTNKITNPSFDHSTYDTNWANGANDFTTFTAGLSKRNSAGPFASGVLVQGDSWGDSSGDLLTFPLGSQVSGDLYSQLDRRQGTIAFWYTPEFNSADVNAVFGLFAFNTDYAGIELSYDGRTGYKRFNFNAGNAGNITSSQTLTAGTTYLIIARWSTDYKIDGTNYLSLSINDSHTFGTTNAPAVSATTADIKIGQGNSGGVGAADGIIEGFTIYRRPLYDGSYGIDAGNGDELNLIYNSGTGQDPTIITGSWDVVFALPTDASTGTITSGTGNAWSHPHASNLLYTSTSNTGGFMMNGTYTSDGWTSEGTPTAVAALATAEKIFGGGYKTTSDAANEGIYYDKTVTGGDDLVVRALAHSDGTCVPRVILYDQTGSAEIGHLDGATGNDRDTPAVLLFSGEVPSSGSRTLRVKLVNTASSGICYWHQIEVLNNQVNHPSFETGSGDPWMPTGFDVNNPAAQAGEFAQETSNIHSGLSSWKANGVGVYGRSGIYDLNTTFSTNSFVSVGFASYDASNAFFGFHECPDPYRNVGATSGGENVWKYDFNVIKMLSPCGEGSHMNFLSSTVGVMDDYYALQANDVSLTITPATATNSVESNKIRVDGRDTYTHTYPGPTTSAGTYTFDYNPRHSAADVAKFGEATPLVAHFYGDANDYIKLLWSAANTVKLEYQMNGGSVTSTTWDATSAITAGTTYRMVVTYTGSGNMILSVDGVTKITLSSIPAAFGTAPTTAYWGSDQAGTQQGDAAFLPQFTTYSANTTAPYFKFGTKSSKIDNSTAPEARGFLTSINAGNTNTHTLSAYVYDGTSGNVGGTVSSSIAVLVFNGATQTTTYTDMGGGWWRLTYSGAGIASAQNFGVQVKSAKIVYVDGVQLEEKAYSTTYTDGTLGTGYAWTSTAHASTSTRTASDVVYSETSNISGTKGTISLWVNRDRDCGGFDAARYCTFFNYGALGHDAYDRLGITYDSYQFTFYKHYNGSPGSTATASVTSSFTKGAWYHLVATWSDSEGMKLYVNNSSPGSSANTNTISTSSIYLGSGYWQSSTYAGGKVSDTRILNDAVSAAEVADLYYTGLGSHQVQSDYTERFSGTEGPVLNWHLDEGYGTTAHDSTLKANSGTISEATWSDDTFSSPPQGKSLQFDGSNDYAYRTYDADDELDPSTQPFSVSTWFKHPSSQAGTDTLIARYSSSGYKLYMNSSGYLCFGVDDDSTWGPDDSACSTISYSDSQWHLATAVRESTNIALYVDGMKVASDDSLAITGHLSGANPTLYAGIDSDGSSNPWTGFIDDVRVYSHALTTAEILAELSARGSVKGVSTAYATDGTNSALNQGLVGYWKMDEDSNSRYDSSGNGNTLTDYNTVSSGSGKYGNAGLFVNTNSEYLRIDDNQSLSSENSDLFVSAWIYLNSTGGRDIMAKRGPSGYEWQFGLNGDTKLSLYLSGVGTVSDNGASLTTGNWYFVTGWFNNSNKEIGIQVYGTEPTRTIGSGSIAASSAEFQIGNASGFYFDGLIDEVRYYKRTLSPPEVQALYTWAPGPKLHYQFEEGSGSAVNDSSGNGLTGSSSGTYEYTNGKYSKGLKHAGGSYTVVTSEGATFSSNKLTVSAWVNRISDSGTDEAIVHNEDSSGDGWKMLVTSTDKVACYHNNTESLSSESLSLNTWYYVTCSWDGTTQKLYLGGVLADNDGISGSISETIDLAIGARSYGLGSNRLYGVVDEVKIYNYARTPQQIVEDMNAGHPAPGSPVGSALIRYQFDEGYDSTAHNSGNGGSSLNGSITSGAWSNSGKLGKALTLTASSSITATITDPGYTNSVSIWVYPTTSAASKKIVTTAKLTTDVSSKPTYGSCTGTALSLSTWTHIVAVSNGSGSCAIYQNGELTATGSTGVTFGTSVNIGDSSYIGSVDEFKLYTSALTAEQVKVEYNQGKSQVLGSLSTTSDGTTADNSASRAYCPPGNVEENCAVGQNPAPVAEWKLDDPSINSGQEAVDTSGNGETGTLGSSGSGDSADPSWVDGKIGKGLSFDGGDYVSRSDTILSSAFTINAWIKPSLISGTQTIFAQGPAYTSRGRLFLDSSGYLVLNVLSANSTSTTALSPNSWYFVTGRFDGTNAYVYINGNLMDGPDADSYALGDSDRIRIGSNPDNSNFFNGLIDNVKIYNYARTPAQIAWDYNQGDPVAHYKLDECTGGTIHSNNEVYNSGLNGTWSGSGGSQTSVGDCDTPSSAWYNGAAGKFNSSLNFDGTDDKVTVNSTANINLFNELSFGAWVKTSYSGSNSLTLLSKGDFEISGTTSKYSLALSSSGYPVAYYKNLSYSLGGTTNIRDGNWHHVFSTISSQNNSWKLYVDGAMVATSGVTAAASTDTTGNLDIGALVYYGGSGSFMLGQIDDARIYNYALSEQQVKLIYNGGQAVNLR